jgi:hypothetical protein
VEDVANDANVEKEEPMVEAEIETAPNSVVNSTVPRQESELPIIPEAVPVLPVTIKKYPARDLIDSIDDAEKSDIDDDDDDEEGSDDEELDAGGGVPTARKKLYSDEKLAEIVALCR